MSAAPVAPAAEEAAAEAEAVAAEEVVVEHAVGLAASGAVGGGLRAGRLHGAVGPPHCLLGDGDPLPVDDLRRGGGAGHHASPAHAAGAGTEGGEASAWTCPAKALAEEVVEHVVPHSHAHAHAHGLPKGAGYAALLVAARPHDVRVGVVHLAGLPVELLQDRERGRGADLLERVRGLGVQRLAQLRHLLLQLRAGRAVAREPHGVAGRTPRHRAGRQVPHLRVRHGPRDVGRGVPHRLALGLKLVHDQLGHLQADGLERAHGVLVQRVPQAAHQQRHVGACARLAGRGGAGSHSTGAHALAGVADGLQHVRRRVLHLSALPLQHLQDGAGGLRAELAERRPRGLVELVGQRPVGHFARSRSVALAAGRALALRGGAAHGGGGGALALLRVDGRALHVGRGVVDRAELRLQVLEDGGGYLRRHRAEGGLGRVVQRALEACRAAVLQVGDRAHDVRGGVAHGRGARLEVRQDGPGLVRRDLLQCVHSVAVEHALVPAQAEGHAHGGDEAAAAAETAAPEAGEAAEAAEAGGAAAGGRDAVLPVLAGPLYVGGGVADGGALAVHLLQHLRRGLGPHGVQGVHRLRVERAAPLRHQRVGRTAAAACPEALQHRPGAEGQALRHHGRPAHAPAGHHGDHGPGRRGAQALPGVHDVARDVRRGVPHAALLLRQEAGDGPSGVLRRALVQDLQGVLVEDAVLLQPLQCALELGLAREAAAGGGGPDGRRHEGRGVAHLLALAIEPVQEGQGAHGVDLGEGLLRLFIETGAELLDEGLEDRRHGACESTL
mmetsp:Transcript_91674/g.296617  ORF Transcript_91674/g.296617 Transcript_91674/m.296617 type:complete len:783 (+) Transcript_91674:196-2544(+)